MKEKISMIIFVLILGSVLTSTLVAVDQYTAPRIKKNEELKIKTRVLGALDIPYTEDNVEEKFTENVDIREIEGKNFYISKQNGDIAFEIAGSGLWGPIKGILALLPDLETIKGIAIIHQEETPGLGGRIAEKDFLDKFKDKKVVPELRILTRSKEIKKENEVDGITGATMSSKAFEKIINSQFKEYIPLM